MTKEQQGESTETIISVDELQNHGINAGDITKLKSVGIYSIAVSITVNVKTKKKKKKKKKTLY